MEKLTEEQRKKRQQEIEEKKEYLRGYEKAVRQMKRSAESQTIGGAVGRTAVRKDVSKHENVRYAGST